MNSLTDIFQAYERGKQDRAAGLMLNANPYTDAELRGMWIEGWGQG